jgi:hypothetical protein|tara:strand:+ start:75 stop:461 length:387 start_codon:yes stop_codon:yes gene_type:complete
MLTKSLLILLTVATLANSASANTTCIVQNKLDALTGNVYSAEQLKSMQFSLRLDTEAQTMSRCSFQKSAGTVTCDTYNIDKVAIASGFVDIKKYYYFSGQFDLQIFNNYEFVENNGRGSIATGICVQM